MPTTEIEVQSPRRRVMLVESDPHVRSVLTAQLTNAGYEVLGFDSFEPARHSLQCSVPEAILADVRLGAYNGLQLVMQAKMDSPDIVAIVTGSEDPVLRAETANAGARYLVKPCSITDVLAAFAATLPSVH